MTTLTTRLGLIRPTTADHFSTADLEANLDKLDLYANSYKCTSTTRPIWGANQAGMTIYETDTDLAWRWTGSLWRRVAPRGWLAGASRTTALTVSGTTPIVVVQSAVTVPAGLRTLDVRVLWQELRPSSTGSGTGTACTLSIWRDTSMLHAWDINVPLYTASRSIGGNGGGLSFPDTPAAGAYTYSFQFALFGYTGYSVSMQCAVAHSAQINVYET